MIVRLPFPPSALSGHNNGHWRNSERIVATWRAEAMHLTRDAARKAGFKAPETGDIGIRVHFVPPNNLGDRVNYPIRIKPQIDGIAEALNVNDKRFLPSYSFALPVKPGWVEYEIFPQNEAGTCLPQTAESAKESGPETLLTQRPALTNREMEVRNGS